ncbi:MAG: cytochrome c peroxidase [Leeuwenhoekiella sp.]
MRTTSKILIIWVLPFFFACAENKDKEIADASYQPGVDWTAAQNYYAGAMAAALSDLDSLQQLEVSDSLVKPLFAQLRTHFKKAEAFGAYLNPEIGHRANGPALPVYKEDTGKVVAPLGLQKLEETIYEEGSLNEQYLYELRILKGLLNNLKMNIEKRELTPQRFFTATHQQLLRIISLGISGFDTPVSQLGLAETQVSLKSLYDVYQMSIQAIVREKDESLDEKFGGQIENAINFIGTNPDFETFDRYTFIRNYMNPITRSWVQIRKTSGLWDGKSPKPFNFDAETFFDEDAWNVEYFKNITNRNASQEQIALGEKLFFEPKLSNGGSMACATCHIPEKGWADGLKVNKDNQGNDLDRNTPTVINSVYQKALFWDGRSKDLMSQISAVFTNEREFAGNVHEFSSEIVNDAAYLQSLRKAYNKKEVSNKEVIRALSSYIATLNGLNSKFDRNMRGEENTFTSEEKNGMNLFMGKALCATCHFMPLTNGTVPPFYAETEKEVIGVPETSANKILDDDRGFYWVFEDELHDGMFKTPTVRNAAITAPYMHNGVYETLDQVMDFYNQGGGAGLGFDLPHQTLPFDNLNLTREEQDAIVAFIQTMTDAQVDKPEPNYSETL